MESDTSLLEFMVELRKRRTDALEKEKKKEISELEEFARTDATLIEFIKQALNEAADQGMNEIKVSDMELYSKSSQIRPVPDLLGLLVKYFSRIPAPGLNVRKTYEEGRLTASTYRTGKYHYYLVISFTV